jgi:antitoxin protein of toxin-antitoxin system
MGFLDDAKKFADEHDEQVDAATEKAGDLADQQTGGKYAGQVDKAQDFAEGKTGEGDTAR